MPTISGRDRSSRRRRSVSVRDRGQSNLIGFVLLIGMTVAGVTTVVALGASGLDDARRNAQIGSAEHAMTQFDSRTSLVALGPSQNQQVTVPKRGDGVDLYVDDSAGWMNVTVFNDSTGDVKTVVMNATMGAVIYENGDTEIAYQGGGVWRLAPSGGSSLISPPEFHYRTDSGDPTLTLPLVVVGGEGGTLDERVLVSENGSTESKYPVTGNGDRSNPLTSGKVNITVQSQYYEAWGQFFEERTDGNVTYDHSREIATIELVVPTGSTSNNLSSAISVSPSGGTSMEPEDANIDSYNSSVDNYDSFPDRENGDISIAGDMKMASGTEIHGTVRVDGNVKLEGGTIDGDLHYDSKQESSTTITGDEHSPASVDPTDPIDSDVNSKIDEIRDDNPNNGTLESSETLGASGNGQHFYENIELESSETLILDTSGGDIELAVDDQIKLEGGATIEVTGPGKAEIYINEFTGDNAFKMDSSTVTVGSDDKSPQLWLYGTSETQIEIVGSTFKGVIYAPTDASSGGWVKVQDGSEVFGALVGGLGNSDSFTDSDYHYDEALADEQPLGSGGGTTAPELTYLHVSINRVNVTAP